MLHVSDRKWVHQALVDPKSIVPYYVYGIGTSSPCKDFSSGILNILFGLRPSFSSEPLLILASLVEHQSRHQSRETEKKPLKFLYNSIQRTCDRYMLAIQITSSLWTLHSFLTLLCNGCPIFSCSRTLDDLSSKLGFDGIADFINDKRDSV